MVGSFMVSYARARAEGLGYDCEVGLLQRPERIILLGSALVLSPLHPWIVPAALGLLLIATAVTTVQRIVHVWRLVRAGVPRR
jgi:CDP-diacylglycerol--glycerol-3-phosphate 3-phosphatidyltransferase